jgi:hypothetical protein
VFQCPAAPSPESIQTVVLYIVSGRAHTDYPSPTATATFSFSGSPGDAIMGRTNYVANAGFPKRSLSSGGAPVDVDGPFRYNRNDGAKVGAVSDGLSNSIFFMEAAGSLVNGRQTSHTWANGLYWPQYGLCPQGAGTTGGTGEGWTSNCDGFRAFVPNSKHAGDVINTAFGDGQVRPVRTGGMNLTPWAVLNGINEGFVNPSDY